MNNALEEIYYTIEENLNPDFLEDPEYKRRSRGADQLWEQLAADLGKDGSARLSEFADARADKDEFWRRALFRRALALGVTLGRLE